MLFFVGFERPRYSQVHLQPHHNALPHHRQHLHMFASVFSHSVRFITACSGGATGSHAPATSASTTCSNDALWEGAAAAFTAIAGVHAPSRAAPTAPHAFVIDVAEANDSGVLDLSGQDLASLHSFTLALQASHLSLRFIQTLDISQNRLVSLQGLPSLLHVKSLSLRFNCLRTFHGAAAQPVLDTLYFTGNPMCYASSSHLIGAMALVLFPQLRAIDGTPIAASDQAQAAALRGRSEVLIALRMGWVAVPSSLPAPASSSHTRAAGECDPNESVVAPCARVPAPVLKPFLLELFKRIVNQVTSPRSLRHIRPCAVCVASACDDACAGKAIVAQWNSFKRSSAGEIAGLPYSCRCCLAPPLCGDNCLCSNLKRRLICSFAAHDLAGLQNPVAAMQRP